MIHHDLLTSMAAAGVEIERKFLVHVAPDALTAHPHAAIVQGYLCYEEKRGQVRVRCSTDTRQLESSYYLTAKRRQGISRDEVNVPLTRENFHALWPLTSGRRLAKRRYFIPHGELTIEVDVYGGPHAGLIVAEVEFPDLDTAVNFKPLPWMAEDVTKNPAYRNSLLARE